jgi:2'-5' RNA ligase
VRLFVAVWPSPEVARRVASLARPDRPGVRWLPPDTWHVTLRFFGQAERDEAWEALAGARLPSIPPVAEMGPATTLIGANALCVPVAGLEGLAEAVTAATAGVGMAPRSARFRGHLTLARGRDRKELRGLVGEPLAGSWPVEEVTLVSSLTRPEGARYTVEGRLPLG